MFVSQRKTLALELTECYPNNCTLAGFLAMMKEKRPVSSPWRTPAYSDAGYAILGRVLERLTGVKYE
jgi:CubicO group peptidase (beta-lactamase class C family)